MDNRQITRLCFLKILIGLAMLNYYDNHVKIITMLNYTAEPAVFLYNLSSENY